MRWLLSFPIALSCFLLTNTDALCSETYYIGSDRVLLYKIINWWYDCPPEESTRLCGSTIKCQSTGDTRVEYIESETTLRLHISGGFAGLVSIFKEYEHCAGPSHLKCAWLNMKYFGQGEPVSITNDVPAISSIVITNIDQDHGRLIQGMEKDIVIELEGTVCGLMDGRIALHRGGEFLKECPNISQGRDGNAPIWLIIINSSTKELLARYHAIFEH